MGKFDPITYAGIERGKLFRKVEPILQPVGFGEWKRVKPELGLTMSTHGNASPGWRVPQVHWRVLLVNSAGPREYSAYNKVGGTGMVHAACWTHARRSFANVVKLNPGDPVATRIVAGISKLFAVDAEAREQGLTVEARHRLRQQKAPELLQKIKADIEAAKPGALPGGALEGACEYALGIWQRLTCFLQYPELELSTNLAENSMRPIVLGRKNWIHIGSPQAGPKVTAIMSVIETCRRIKISARDYLSAVLPGLADTPLKRLPALTPTAWASQRQ